MSDESPDTDSPIRNAIWSFAWLLVPVLLISGLILATGSVSPFVTLTSDSMAPNLEKGETVVVAERGDWVVLAPNEITTAAEARNQSEPTQSFGSEGDVILFESKTKDISIVHRVQFEVSEGERWVERIENDSEYKTNHSCETAEYCPAPHDGYITAGDNNPTYDQLAGYQPVTDEQVIGVVRFRIPLL
jgi:signal peptidase